MEDSNAARFAEAKPSWPANGLVMPSAPSSAARPALMKSAELPDLLSLALPMRSDSARAFSIARRSASNIAERCPANPATVLPTKNSIGSSHPDRPANAALELASRWISTSISRAPIAPAPSTSLPADAKSFAHRVARNDWTPS